MFLYTSFTNHSSRGPTAPFDYPTIPPHIQDPEKQLMLCNPNTNLSSSRSDFTSQASPPTHDVNRSHTSLQPNSERNAINNSHFVPHFSPKCRKSSSFHINVSLHTNSFMLSISLATLRHSAIYLFPTHFSSHLFSSTALPSSDNHHTSSFYGHFSQLPTLFTFFTTQYATRFAFRLLLQSRPPYKLQLLPLLYTHLRH